MAELSDEHKAARKLSEAQRELLAYLCSEKYDCIIAGRNVRTARVLQRLGYAKLHGYILRTWWCEATKAGREVSALVEAQR